MYALISREKIQLLPGTVVRMPGTWQDYQALAQSRGDSSIPRIKYRTGEICAWSLPRNRALVLRFENCANACSTLSANACF